MSPFKRRPLFINRLGQRRHRPDYWLLLLTATLLTLGLIVIYAISPGLSAQKEVSENYYVSKQLIAIGLGIVAFIVMAHVPIQAWRRLQKPLIILAVIAAVAVRLFGQEVYGAHRWIQIGGLSFQAAEFIKFALLIWLASFLSDRIQSQSLNSYERTIKPLLLALAAIAGVVIVLQSDLGSAGVMVAMMAVMAFVAGIRFRQVAFLGLIVLIGTTIAISSSAYRRDRFLTFLHPTVDCQDSGYQACQAINAIGSGGMFGLGLARSVYAYGYLPEAANDSIFAILAEKFGFVGVTVLLGLLVAFFSRLKSIAERATDDFSRLLVVGVFAWLSTQAIINIGAMLGLLPLKGITLPFISYGGTSIVFVTGAIGLVFQISRYTTFIGSNQNSSSEGNRNDNYTDRRRQRRPYYATVSRRP